MLQNIFGRHSYPFKKMGRMLYWMPKFKNISPWPLPHEVPKCPFELAQLAMKRMTSVDPSSEIETFETKELEDAVDQTWVVSGQSPVQRELVKKLKDDQTVYVEGAFCLWLRNKTINYFILRTEPVKPAGGQESKNSQFDHDGELFPAGFRQLH